MNKLHKTPTPNPYATNRGGKIEAPHNPAANDPSATRKRGEDLRAGK